MDNELSFIDKRHLHKNKTRLKISPKLRYNILKRDGFVCQYCGSEGNNDNLEVDHIIPVSRGGTNDEDNLLTSCRNCNRGKSNTNILSKNNSSIIYPLNIINPIINSKPAIALFSFKKEDMLTTADISRKINSNFAYSFHIIKILEKHMLVERVKDHEHDKRKKYFKITGKGELVTLKLLEIVYLMDG